MEILCIAVLVSVLVFNTSDVQDGPSCGFSQVSEEGPGVEDHVRGDMGWELPRSVERCLDGQGNNDCAFEQRRGGRDTSSGRVNKEARRNVLRLPPVV